MPVSKAAARRLILRRLLENPSASTQEQLVRMLSAEGHTVAQATVSRDLAAIGALKSEGPSGEVIYSLQDRDVRTIRPNSAILRWHFREFVTRIDASLNLAVIQTQPSAAPTVAATLDAADIGGVLGTVAGDDTVIVVNRDPDGGAAFIRSIEKTLEG